MKELEKGEGVRGREEKDREEEEEGEKERGGGREEKGGEGRPEKVWRAGGRG